MTAQEAKLIEENRRLRAQVEVLRAALQHYSDPVHWYTVEAFIGRRTFRDHYYRHDVHGYTVAQAALAEAQRLEGRMTEGPSYHDVRVYVDGVEYRIDRDYGLELTCTKVGGWSLWRRCSRGQPTLIGGEFDSESFRIEVQSVVVCDRPRDTGRPE